VAPALESFSAFLLHALGNFRAVVALSAARVVSAVDARTFFFFYAVSFYLVRWVGVLSVIGQNKLTCDWSE
jgi:hypothetical protein